ncbi:MAG: DNA topoisomerase VI subunit B [Candidatus Thermoplasmatota archaeon]|jgi:DNA topoisomerase-6 subunit B|nr:DNA topoisomerase VI subunit B [Candidatus Thermoplasmatota archaeon]
MRELETDRKEVSISEFFDKNKQMLGFDSPQKALFMTVKEAVDNSLDACADAGILPEISIKIEEAGKERYRVEITDNGPGIVRSEVANSFGKMLYGSRFFKERQTRGQQGLGISAAILYAQKTAGFPTEIITKVEGDLTAFHFVLDIDIKKNSPHVISTTPEIWDVKSGLKIILVLRGKYVSGKQSVEEYIRESAIANPHSTFHLTLPDKRFDIERSVNEPPQIPIAVKPHPHGVELGELISILKEYENEKIEDVLEDKFSRVTKQTAKALVEKSKLKDKKISRMTRDDFEELLKTIRETEFMEPKKDCLSPIGEEPLFKSAMNSFKEYHPAYFSQAVVRGPFVFSGHPFLVEAIAIYGGDLPKEEPIKVLRFANRVPLLYQQGSCAITRAISSLNWNQYGFSQPVKDQLPIGPLIIAVHVASTKIPFTSEAKEAIATVPEIMDALDILLKGVARQIKTMRKKEAHKGQVEEKFALIEQILPQIAAKSSKILGLEPPDITPIISKVMGVVAFREVDGALYAENYTEKLQSFKVVLKGEGTFTETVKNLKPFQKVKLNFSREIVSSTEVYVDLPEPILLGAYSLPKVFNDE